MTIQRFQKYDDLESSNIIRMYQEYSKTLKGSIHNIFYSFMIDRQIIIQNFLISQNSKYLLINSSGLFVKKSDIFRTVCIDKISQHLICEKKMYCFVDQNVYIDDKCFHKPDIAVFLEMDEDSFEDYVDLYMRNPQPSIVIEVIDITDAIYIGNLIEVYRRIIYKNHDMMVLFVDPIKEELFVMRNDIKCDKGLIDQFIYLIPYDYKRDIFYKQHLLNFNNILMKK